MFAVLLRGGHGTERVPGAADRSSHPHPNNVAPTTGVYIPNLENGEAAWKKRSVRSVSRPASTGRNRTATGCDEAAVQQVPGDRADRAFRPSRLMTKPRCPARPSTISTPGCARSFRRSRPSAPPTSTPAGGLPEMEQMMSMTIWTCKKCSTCHGVFAQGSATAPCSCRRERV